MIINKFAIAWVLCFPALTIAQTTSDSLSLQALATKAIDKNKGIKNSQLEIKISEYTKEQIHHTFIPTLSLDGKYAYTSGEINLKSDPYAFHFPGMTLPTTNGPVSILPFDGALPALDQSIDFNGNLWMGGLTAKWTLFTGFKATYLSKAMTHKIEAQRQMLSQEEADLISEIAEYYDKIALLAQTQKVLDIQHKRLDKENEVATKALEEGLITHHDYQKIEIAQLNIQAKVLEFEGVKELLYLKLHQLTGVEVSQLENLKVDIDVRLESEALDKSYLDRPELVALDESTLATEYKYKSEISGYLPKVQAFASHQYMGLTNGRTGDMTYSEMSAYPMNMIGVGLKWEIFDGLHTRDERKKIKIEIEQTENRKEEVKELLELNYKNCVSQYANLSAQTRLKEKQLKSAEEAAEISYKEYKNGLVELSEFLEAQANYTTATMDYYAMICDQRNSALELLKATGSLQIDKL